MSFRIQKTFVVKCYFCAIALAGCAPASVPPVKPPDNYRGPVAEAPAAVSGDSWIYEYPDGRQFRGSTDALLKNNNVRFPLWNGKQWSYETEVTRMSGRSLHPHAPERANIECEVAGFENVTVKAGTFEAFACKCKCELTIRPLIFSEYCGGFTVWYAPAIRNIVRVKTEDTGSTYELAKYRFSKRGLDPGSYEAKDVDDFLDRGRTYLDRKDYDRAIEEYNRALQLDSKNTDALFYRAWARGEKRDYDGAIQGYTDYIQLNPNSAAAFNNRGNIYRNRKEYDRALEDYDRAIQLNAKYALAFYNRGILYRERKDYDRAIADLDQAIRLNPRYDSAFNMRGNVYRDKKEYDRAIQDYSEAIRITPTFATAFNNRALAYRDKQEYDRALADYESAARIDSKIAQHRLIGYIHFYRGETEKSAEALKRAVDSTPQNLYAVIWRYLTTAKTVDTQAAVRELTEHAAKIGSSEWPRPVIDFYLGRIDEKTMIAAAENAEAAKIPERMCEANFYSAEAKLLKGMNEEAGALLRAAEQGCPMNFNEAHAARAELRRLAQR